MKACVGEKETNFPLKMCFSFKTLKIVLLFIWQKFLMGAVIWRYWDLHSLSERHSLNTLQTLRANQCHVEDCKGAFC